MNKCSLVPNQGFLLVVLVVYRPLVRRAMWAGVGAGCGVRVGLVVVCGVRVGVRVVVWCVRAGLVVRLTNRLHNRLNHSHLFCLENNLCSCF